MDDKTKQSRAELVKFIEKKFGKGSFGVASKMTGLKVDRLPTGSISIDIETGGGLPKGRLTEIYGWESSGKTWLCLSCVASVQQFVKDKNCLWIDVEGCYDQPWAEIVGVDHTRLDITRPESAEQVGTILDAAVRANCYSLIILDSVAALEPAEDIDKSMDQDERIGNRAMINNRIVRKLQSALNCKEDGTILNETTVVFTNQLRESIGVMYGPTEVTTGGMGIKFGASIRIEMRRGETTKEAPLDGEHGVGPDGKLITGVLLKFKTTKNKTFTPLKTGQFLLHTAREMKGKANRVDEIMRYGISSGIITAAGPSYTLGTQKFIGKEKLLDYLTANPTIVEEVFAEVKKVYLHE